MSEEKPEQYRTIDTAFSAVMEEEILTELQKVFDVQREILSEVVLKASVLALDGGAKFGIAFKAEISITPEKKKYISVGMSGITGLNKGIKYKTDWKALADDSQMRIE